MTIWLTRDHVLAMHDLLLTQHGGAAGMRDQTLLESALARPLNHAGYGNPDPAELAALYALGIARNHPFIDGNKRTAWAAMVLFLSLNGLVFEPPDGEAVSVMLAMAGGEMRDDGFIAWVRGHAHADD
jgi:death-on-curing protein